LSKPGFGVLFFVRGFRMNWNVLVIKMSADLKNFVNGRETLTGLYKKAIKLDLGPELRPLVRGGVERARKVTKLALKRRNLV
jgi:hypothetical protein